MKEQKKNREKYNIGFIRRLIIDFLHYFISFLLRILSFVSHIIIIYSQFLLKLPSYCYHPQSIMIKKCPQSLGGMRKVRARKNV